jgi:hypothetical protein
MCIPKQMILTSMLFEEEIRKYSVFNSIIALENSTYRYSNAKITGTIPTIYKAQCQVLSDGIPA